MKFQQLRPDTTCWCWQTFFILLVRIVGRLSMCMFPTARNWMSQYARSAVRRILTNRCGVQLLENVRSVTEVLRKQERSGWWTEVNTYCPTNKYFSWFHGEFCRKSGRRKYLGQWKNKQKERLISRISRLLSLIETPANQSIIKQIEGLLNEIRD